MGSPQEPSTEGKPGRARSSVPPGSRPTEPPFPADHAHLGANSVEQLTEQNVKLIADAERVAQLSITSAERFAARVAAFCGGTAFIAVHVVWFSAWVLLNTLPISKARFDAYPFSLLALLVTIEAVFLAVFILINQKQEARTTEQRSHLNLQINLLAEQENTKMLKMLQRIASKLGADVPSDHDLAVLQSATQPEQVLRQIEKATGRTDETTELEKP